MTSELFNGYHPDLIFWAGLYLPSFIAKGHFLLVGTPGSGKTLVMRQLMGSVFRHFVAGTDRKAIVYDDKGDFISQARAGGACCPIHVMNPFDRRSRPWAIALDVNSPAAAVQFAESLIPPGGVGGNESKYWVEAARRLIVAAIETLNHYSPGTWTLRDFVELVSRNKRFLGVLEQSPAGIHIFEQYEKTDPTFGNVIQTLGNQADLLRPVAALWERATEKPLSLAEWVMGDSNPSIMTLGGTSSYASTLQVLNRLLFGFVTELVTSRGEASEENRFWFFCDELTEAGRLGSVPKLVRKGRSKGCRCVLGIQNLPDFFDAYGEKAGKGIIGNIRNVSILAVACLDTAKWASELIGQYRALSYETSAGVNMNYEGKETLSFTETVKHVERYAVLPAEILKLPPVDDYVPGFHIIPAIQTVTNEPVRAEFYEGSRNEDFQARDREDQLFRPWEVADFDRLNLPRPEAGGIATLERPAEHKALPLALPPQVRRRPIVSPPPAASISAPRLAASSNETPKTKRFRRQRDDGSQ